MSRTRRPAPPPLEANDQLVIAIITAAWAIALIVLLAVRTQVPASDRWWIWTCAFGTCAGLFGYWYVPRLKRSRARGAERRAASALAAARAAPASSGRPGQPVTTDRPAVTREGRDPGAP